LNTAADPYAVALISYALEMAGSPQAAAAYDKLMNWLSKMRTVYTGEATWSFLLGRAALSPQ